ncbi:hypothetical protein GX408_16655 [bacterium]|nr:hypothetical protein [bacterium]
MKLLKFFLFTLILQTSAMGQTQLSRWEKGFLDIHFISTGRGNSAFYVMPDGTTLLVDMGELPSNNDGRGSPAVPDSSKSAAQWVADYIQQFHPDEKKAALDYALITHYHGDHMGSAREAQQTHQEGKYKLFGITELGSIIPIRKLIDRGYDHPLDFREAAKEPRSGSMRGLGQFEDYWKFIEYQKKTNGLVYEKFRVGSVSQFQLIKSREYADFTIKNLFANGDVAGIYDTTVAVRKFKKGEMVDENNLSCGIKISYGKFDFYTGGDIPGIGHTGEADFFSMESYAAPVIGQVDVATLNHHGNRDSQNEYFVRTLQPRVWIGQSWTVRHPGEEVVRRITSRFVYPGERDLFTNFLHPANRTFLGSMAEEHYQSTSGHIVLRVQVKGDQYDIFILDDKTTERSVIGRFSYLSR